jgi:hypothetical protein
MEGDGVGEMSVDEGARPTIEIDRPRLDVGSSLPVLI